jgi:hypothetical protein
VKRNFFRVFVAFMLVLSFSILTINNSAQGATITSAASGSWNATSTWSGGAIPTAADSVVIAAGHMVTIPAGLTANATSINISINNLATQNGITLAANTSRLVLTGAVTLNLPASSAGTLFAIDAGTLSGATTLAIPGSGNVAQVTTFRISTGTANFSGGITFSGTAAQAKLTFNGTGTLNVGGNISSGGTFTASNGTVNYNSGTLQTVGGYTYNNLTLSGNGPKTLGAATVISGNMTVNSGAPLNMSTFSLTLNGDLINNGGTVNGTSGGVTITGTANQSIGGFNTTGTVSMTKTGGTATFTGNVSGGGLTINGAGGTLNLGTGLTHNFTGTWTRTAGTIDGGSSTLKLSSITPTSGSGGTFTPNAGTINYAAAAAQPLGSFIYYNLTVSGSGVKTVVSVTVNGTMSMEGTATVDVAPTYGGAATLQYNTATSRTAGVEWITPFVASGGVIIANTGNITMNAGKVFNASAPLTVNSGSSLNMSTSLLTLNGNLINNGGTVNGTSGGVTIAGTANQSIGAFATTGTVSMTKTGGTATVTGNISGGGLTINGAGGTLNLGAGFTHTFTGNWTRTIGTLSGNSSTLNIAGNVTNTAGTFTAGTGTVNYNGPVQTVANVTYNNLTLSGSGAKTTTGVTVNGILSLEGTATASTVPTYGASATLQYKGSASQTTGTEFPTSFNGTGGVIINNASGVNLGSSVTISNGLTLTSGTFSVGANTLTLNGTPISGTPGNLSTNSSSILVFGGSSTGVNVPGSVTALGSLTVNNVNGITVNSNPTISGNLTLGNGRITTGANTLNLTANSSISGGNATSYVNGRLGKVFNTGNVTSFTFPVGDGSYYTPVTVANMTVNVSGSLVAYTTAGEHPNIATSGIDATKSVNRYWTLTAGGGLVVSSYNGTFNFLNTDVDGGANTANFIVQKYSSGAWSSAPGGSVTAATNTTGRSFTSFGDFAIGEPKTAPTVTGISLYQTDRTTAVTSMTPQVEYAAKVSINNTGNLSALTTVLVKVYYDAGGTYNSTNIPSSGNTQTAAILTLNVSGSPSWGIDSGTNTTWSIVSADCVQPGLNGTSGDFWFNFKPGKVATAATGKWFIYAQATSPYGSGSSHQDSLTMNWYGEISVNAATLDFGNVTVGSDFSANAKTGITVTYISNGAYNMQVKLSSPWSGSGKSVTLNASGTPGAGEFSVKANSSNNLSGSVVATTSYVTIGSGTQTGENGITNNTQTLWLKLGGSGIPAVQYSGTIYYGISP